MITTVMLGVMTALAPSCKKDKKLTIQQLVDSIIQAPQAGKLLSVEKIYDADRHCAFTDLIKWHDNYYIVFRSSDGHAYSRDGELVVLKSADGNEWTKEVTYKQSGFDLRDPKFIVSPKGDLLVYGQAVIFNEKKEIVKQEGVVVGANKEIFSRHTPVQVKYNEAYWPWRFSTPYKDTAYALAYSPGGGTTLKLLRTTSFSQLEDICNIGNIGNSPSEATLRFRNNKCYALVRCSGPAAFGVSGMNDICNFNWSVLPLIGLGGPNFIFYDDNTIIIAGRDYPSGKFGYYDARTGLFAYKIREKKTYRIMTLPSGQDTSYPGLILGENNELFFSYYSTHEGTTKVYLAKIALQLELL